MKISSPYDWSRTNSSTLDVVLSDLEPDEDLDALECVLWRAETYFEHGVAPALARAHVSPAPGGLALARFEALSAWGSCVIAILRDGALPPVFGTGVILGGSPIPRWLGASPPPGKERLRFPLPVVDCELSQIPGREREPVEVVADLEALLAPNSTGAAVRVLALTQPESIDAQPALSLGLSLTPRKDRYKRLLTETPYVADVPFLADMRDAHLILPSGVILPEGRRIWSDSTHGAFWLDPHLTRTPGLFPVGDEIGLLPLSPRTERDLVEDNGLAASTALPLIAFGQASTNYMHWLFNTVFAVWLIREAVQAGRVQVVVPDLSPLTVSSMASIGIGRESLLAAQPGCYHFKRALYPSTLSTYSNKYPPRAIADMCREIARTARPTTTSVPPELIYVTREGAPSMRHMTNERALVEALRSRGFEVIAPHELSFGDEVRAFSRARMVIGQLGAGLCNIAFAPQGCQLVELITDNYVANDFWYLCAVVGHRCSRVMIRANDNDDEFCSTPFSFTVPLDETLRLVDEALARL